MPNFWNGIRAANGANTLGVIVLGGKLNEELSLANKQGKVFIHAVERTGSSPGFDLGIVDGNPGDSDEVKEVYWLPWKNRSVTKVLVNDLNASNCDHFLTSMLTGCRFVATDTYVAHVSNEQGTEHAPKTDQGSRDSAESTLMMSTSPTTRRKLSVSATSSPGINWSGDDVIASYQRHGKEGAGSALVLGYKENGAWTFKWLMLAEGANSPAGAWAIL